MDVDEIGKYISQNAIPTKPGRKCVDGRYGHDENSGMIARPGGDLGYVMVLVALAKQKNLELSPEQWFDMVHAILQKMGEKFYLHTDHHATPEGIGCGHAAKPMNEDLASTYKLDPTEQTRLVAHAKQVYEFWKDKDGSVVMVNLPGEHKEKAVLVVNNPDGFSNPTVILGIHSSILPPVPEEMFSDQERQDASQKGMDCRLQQEGYHMHPGEHKEKAVLVVNNPDKTVNSKDGEHIFFVYDKVRDMEFIDKLVPLLDLPEISVEEFKKMSDIQTNATLHNLARGLQIFEINEQEVREIGTVE